MFSLNANEFHIFLARWRKWVEWNHLDNFRLQATQSFQPASDVSFQPRISNVFSSEQSVKACAHQQYPIIPKNCHKTRSKLLCITNHNKSPETYVCICYNLYNAKHTHTHIIYIYICIYICMYTLCQHYVFEMMLVQHCCNAAMLHSPAKKGRCTGWDESHTVAERRPPHPTPLTGHVENTTGSEGSNHKQPETWWWIRDGGFYR